MQKMKTVLAIALACLFVTVAQAQVKPVPKKPASPKAPVSKTTKPVANAPRQVRVGGPRVKITTDSGVIIVRLYDKTPLHRDNFLKLVNEHFFDSLLFHRVIPGFMIQGGDPQSKYAQPGQPLGMGDVGYTIPAEFDSTLFHKRGALAAARMPDNVNPQKASSGCQFYIVQGKKWTDEELNMIEMGSGIKFSPAKRAYYKTTGGTAQLDMGYTVFGEVESGFDVIDKIAGVNRDGNNRPYGNVRMYMEVIK
jgi:cyclophilin family peptidyl-prolyl cis-trans isomerase